MYTYTKSEFEFKKCTFLKNIPAFSYQPINYKPHMICSNYVLYCLEIPSRLSE